MKLRLPNKLVAAIMAAVSPVLCSTISSATLGAAAVAAVGGYTALGAITVDTPTTLSVDGGETYTSTEENPITIKVLKDSAAQSDASVSSLAEADYTVFSNAAGGNGSRYKIDANTAGVGGAGTLILGKVTYTPDGAADAVTVSSGQMWVTAARTFNNDLILGAYGYKEGGWDGVMRISANTTFTGETTLVDDTKLTLQNGTTDFQGAVNGSEKTLTIGSQGGALKLSGGATLGTLSMNGAALTLAGSSKTYTFASLTSTNTSTPTTNSENAAAAVTLDSGATLVLDGGVSTANSMRLIGGTKVEIRNGASLTLNHVLQLGKTGQQGSVKLNGGSLKVESVNAWYRANVEAISGSLEFTGANAYNASYGTANPGKTYLGITSAGDLSTAGAMVLKATENDWTFQMANSGVLQVGNVTIDSANTHQITLAGAQLKGTVINNSKLTLNGATSIANNGSATVGGTGTTTVGVNMTLSGTNTTLNMGGTWAFNKTLSSAGTLAAGGDGVNLFVGAGAVANLDSYTMTYSDGENGFVSGRVFVAKAGSISGTYNVVSSAASALSDAAAEIVDLDNDQKGLVVTLKADESVYNVNTTVDYTTESNAYKASKLLLTEAGATRGAATLNLNVGLKSGTAIESFGGIINLADGVMLSSGDVTLSGSNATTINSAGSSALQVSGNQTSAGSVLNKVTGNANVALAGKTTFENGVTTALTGKLIVGNVAANDYDLVIGTTNQATDVVDLSSFSAIELQAGASVYYNANANKTLNNITLTGNAEFMVHDTHANNQTLTFGGVTDIGSHTFNIASHWKHQLNIAALKGSGTLNITGPTLAEQESHFTISSFDSFTGNINMANNNGKSYDLLLAPESFELTGAVSVKGTTLKLGADANGSNTVKTIGSVTLDGAVMHSQTKGNANQINIATLKVAGTSTMSQNSWHMLWSVEHLNNLNETPGTLTWNSNTTHDRPSVLKLSDEGDFSGILRLTRNNTMSGAARKFQAFIEIAHENAIQNGIVDLNGQSENSQAALALNAETVNMKGLNGTAYSGVYAGAAPTTGTYSSLPTSTRESILNITGTGAVFSGVLQAGVKLNIAAGGSQTLSSATVKDVVSVAADGALVISGSGNKLSGLITNNGSLTFAENSAVAAVDYQEEVAESWSDGQNGYRSAIHSATLVSGNNAVLGGGNTWTLNTHNAEYADGVLSYTEEGDKTYYINQGVVRYESGSVAASATTTGLNMNGGTLELVQGLGNNHTITATSNGGTIQIDENVALSHTDLDASGAAITLTGNGTYILAAGQSELAQNITLGEDWSGILRVSGTIQPVQFAQNNHRANAHSWVEFAGVTSYLHWSLTVSNAQILLTDTEEAPAFKMTDSSGKTYGFSNTVKGDGTFEVAIKEDTDNRNNTFKFSGSVSGWDGLFKNSTAVGDPGGKRGDTTLLFSDSATLVSADVSQEGTAQLTVKFENSNAVTMNGDIGKVENSGTLNIEAAAPVTFTGAVDADRLTINSGKSATFNAAADKTQSIGTLAGSGALKVTGGQLNINGESTAYSGAVSVSGGRLNINNDVTASSLSIAEGGIVNIASEKRFALTQEATAGDKAYTGVHGDGTFALNFVGGNDSTTANKLTLGDDFTGTLEFSGALRYNTSNLGGTSNLLMKDGSAILISDSTATSEYTVAQNIKIADDANAKITTWGDATRTAVNRLTGSLTGAENTTLTKKDGGKFTLAGDLSGFLGTYAVDGGTLALHVGQGEEKTVTNTITGGGTLAAAGDGKLTLSGNTLGAGLNVRNEGAAGNFVLDNVTLASGNGRLNVNSGTVTFVNGITDNTTESNKYAVVVGASDKVAVADFTNGTYDFSAKNVSVWTGSTIKVSEGATVKAGAMFWSPNGKYGATVVESGGKLIVGEGEAAIADTAGKHGAIRVADFTNKGTTEFHGYAQITNLTNEGGTLSLLGTEDKSIDRFSQSGETSKLVVGANLNVETSKADNGTIAGSYDLESDATLNIKNIGESVTVSLKDLTLADNATMGLYKGESTPAVPASNNEAAVIVGGTLSAGSGATLNANLTMDSGSTLEVQQGGLAMGSSLTLNNGENFVLHDATVTDGKLENYILYTGVDSFALGNTAITEMGWYDAKDVALLGRDIISSITANGETLDIEHHSYVFGFWNGTVSLAESTVPEPATTTLSLLALAGLAARRRRR